MRPPDLDAPGWAAVPFVSPFFTDGCARLGGGDNPSRRPFGFANHWGAAWTKSSSPAPCASSRASSTVDLGIARLHFELGANAVSRDWAFEG